MKQQGRNRHSSAGFGLIELLVVVAILAILALIVLPRLTGGKDPITGKKAPAPRERAKQVQGTAYVEQLNQAILMYRQDYEDQNPPSLQALIGTYGVTPDMLLDPNTRQPLSYDPRTGSIGGANGQTSGPYGLGGGASIPQVGGL